MLERTVRGVTGTDHEICRRDFLKMGALGTVGLSFAERQAVEAQTAVVTRRRQRSAIMIFNLGGPSQLETWDPKPKAPAEVRGPFQAVSTRSPDIQVSELLPLHAKIADKFSIVRSCSHAAAPNHETGCQAMQTGRLFADGVNWPHVGCAASYLRGAPANLPSHVLLPGPMGRTGGNVPHGQDAGFLGAAHHPFVPGANTKRNDGSPHETVDTTSHLPVDTAFLLEHEPRRIQERYGMNRFGQSCLLARRLIEAGVPFVTVNTFLTVFNEPTWDTHGIKPFTTFAELRDTVAPLYDRAYSALIEDLSERGLLEDTLVCCLAEFGRAPRINSIGGRDHWSRCWSACFAGGGVQGGRVIGKSDAIGATPADRPVSPAEVAATVYYSLGFDLGMTLPGPHGQSVPLVDPGIQPISELF